MLDLMAVTADPLQVLPIVGATGLERDDVIDFLAGCRAASCETRLAQRFLYQHYCAYPHPSATTVTRHHSVPQNDTAPQLPLLRDTGAPMIG